MLEPYTINKNFDTKVSFDSTTMMKEQMDEKARYKNISLAQYLRDVVQRDLDSYGEVLGYELQLLKRDIKNAYKLYNDAKESIQYHEQKAQSYKENIESLKNEYIKKSKLISQSNIVYADEEEKIKTILLDVFATNHYRFDSVVDMKEKIKSRSNNVHANSFLVMKLTIMLLDGEITLRELIENPIQHLVDDKKVQSIDTQDFISLKENLWNKYGEYIKKQEQKQQEIEEEKTIIHKPENERLQYVIKQAYHTNYRTQSVMEANIEALCQKYKLNLVKTSNIINQIYQNKLDYLKVIKSDHIYEYCTITPDKINNLEEKTIQPEDEQKLTPIQDMIIHLNRKEPLTEIQDVNSFESQIRRKCNYRSDIKFRELWNILTQIIQGKLTIDDVVNQQI
ncbi:hypothetical protein [Methanosphaera cuniculi]|uniref:hypothetical protein n=1 Tax=Methanosphaera cuniculi TaxID=1077256 RepID=UPI0026EE6459|nr:hypothetical protein [Methanosphaera cuniculi]